MGTAQQQAAAALQASIAQAAALGEDLRPPAVRVLEQLLDAGRPMKAYDLVADFAPGGRAPAPTVVYRALTALLRLGLIHRIESRNAFIACAHPARQHAPAFLICERCGGAEEHDLTGPPAFAQAHPGAITHLVVEATSLCGRCAA